MSKYEKIYEELCQNAKQRNILKETGFEVHHIKPRCLGGNDHKDNLVKLTLREHFIAHKLLVKIYPNNEDLKFAVRIIFNIQGKGLNRTAREYEKYRLEAMANFKDQVIVKDENGKTRKVSKMDPDWISGKLICNAKGTVLCKHITNHSRTKRISKDDTEYNKTWIPFSKGVSKTKEHKEKLSKTRLDNGLSKGENNPMFGQGHKVTGEKNGRFGKPTSDSAKQKQSNAKRKFIEENGVACFGLGKIYMTEPNNGKLKRVDIKDVIKLEKQGYTISISGKQKLIKQGLYHE